MANKDLYLLIKFDCGVSQRKHHCTIRQVLFCERLADDVVGGARSTSCCPQGPLRTVDNEMLINETNDGDGLQS